ncbi:winged helix-turn-helix domain-containing protein [Arsenicicoccus sp. oral taxon 190]|uniref:winged helix-turn-helix domain-containing protein n=1 Tax=Arsenicicoccus sp. oral taxon 190 TaxID=1658671 RepID=UPI00067A0BAA|nr:crosslink repair DNA glycosylase YcaQ family protein [Arsenicicoccus sp. oral taxon 190]AKT51433.1 cytoplasmic protein [Arsenicicoccus sp. oral taxon 190]
MTGTRRLTLPQARRMALAAQGFARPRPAEVGSRDLTRVLQTVQVVQIDSVNVLTRSHYLPFWSRLGGYDPASLDRLRDRAPRRMVEYWAHEASLVPPSTWPLLGFRMHRALEDGWGGMRRVAADHPELVASVLAEVTARGPLTSREVEAALAHDVPRSREDWGWNWSLVKSALEHLFWAGQVTSAGRTPGFERRYAALDRVLPREVLADAVTAPTTPERDPERFVGLVERSARALGVGSEQCLRDYFRLRPEQARSAIATLVERGVLEPAQVEGWRRTAYVHHLARVPRRVEASALLSPFDSLVWQRDRTRALFGFDFRLEIYVPAHLRVHGYYVLPFLHRERLAARVDLKADRPTGRLLVRSTHLEEHAVGDADTWDALQRELAALGRWLGVPDVVHESRPPEVSASTQVTH